MDYSSILEQAQHYTRSFFDTHVNDKLLYHNRKHTEQVVEAAVQIAQHYQLNDEEFFVVKVAASFHDIGYLTGSGPGHEERGANMAQAFLEDREVTAEELHAAIRRQTIANRFVPVIGGSAFKYLGN